MTDTGEFPAPQQHDTQPIVRLDEELRRIKKDAKARREPTEHIHKNDSNYGRVISGITDAGVQSDRTRVGLIVGNGAILSSLPNIPADVIVLNDYNSFIQEWTHFTSEALLRAGTPEEYRAMVYSEQNPLYRELRDRGLQPEAGLDAEIADLGENHFLASPQRFEACKQALQRKQILDFAVDLTDRPALQGFANALEQSNAEITFANMSNVWEHAGSSLEQSLPVLPFNPQANILFSSRSYSESSAIPKTMGVCHGLQGYVDSAKPAYTYGKNHLHLY